MGCLASKARGVGNRSGNAKNEHLQGIVMPDSGAVSNDKRERVVSDGVGGARFMAEPAMSAARSLVARFEKQVEIHRERPAVQDGELVLTYSELDGWANDIAARLLRVRKHHAEPVGLLAGHDASTLAGLLGILKAGKFYVPLNPGDPPTRIEAILDLSAASAVLADPDANELLQQNSGRCELILISRRSEQERLADAPKRHLGSLSYILCTSGTTGVPKGVLQCDRNVLHFSDVYAGALELSHHDRLTLLPWFGFDAAVMDIFGALLNGACLCLYDVKKRGAAGLCDWLHTSGATVWHSTPTLFRAAMASSTREVPDALRFVVFGGEEVSARDVELARARSAEHCRVINGFGPTEATIASQYVMKVETKFEGMRAPIGRPVGGAEIVLLDPAGRPAADTGEIAVRSPYIALGYFGRPDLTAERFVPDPFGVGKRLYKTGDLARWRTDGELEFLGRSDQQVKVRGFRIEPGEIEAALVRHPAVDQAVVDAREDRPGDKQLIGYVVSSAHKSAEASTLRRYLGDLLPDHMIPAAIVVIDALPLTPNGKLDRRALPAPKFSSAVARSAQTPIEEALSVIWSDVLQIECVDVEASLFDQGGHSLNAMHLMTWVNRTFHLNLPLRTLFENPSISRLAGVVDQAVARDPSRKALIFLPTRQEAHVRRSGDRHAKGDYYTIRLVGDLMLGSLKSAVRHYFSRNHELTWKPAMSEELTVEHWTGSHPSEPRQTRSITGGRRQSAVEAHDETPGRLRLWRLAPQDHILQLPSESLGERSIGVAAAEIGDQYTALLAGPSAGTTGTKVPNAGQSELQGQSIPWPITGWQVTSPESQGLKSEAIKKLVDFGIANQIDSVLIARNGFVVENVYVSPFRAGIKHALNSATKAVTATAIAIALEKGLLSDVNRRVVEFLPDCFQRRDSFRDITIQHLLNMRSGIDWTEPLGPHDEDIETSHRMKQGAHWVEFIAEQPMSHRPGTYFNYCSANAHLLSAIVTKIAGVDMARFVQKNLFDHLNIVDFEWASDPQGITIGGWGLSLLPEDLAKIGYLYLRGGVWKDKRLLPMAWTRQLVEASGEVYRGRAYRNFFWCLPHKQVYIANGNHRQLAILIPRLNIVAVLTGRKNYPLETMIDLIIESAEGGNLP
ncbi:amino acid adenylation domain-containing protein [Bradyrhizobium sp. BR 10261]|uniref:amino acid adenylation domain-containing protein n=1 Tax=Bradyrhizobium sp. BR 10261 TaxID=2749992 RepID=UPI001C64C10A|nr:amino acid adenylation domain-containing protein [Bradyrhizobium sp. BR 10261]MBW7967155.1 amino acid adenylation domain-containing protein [Bradyrhizobium sp. BR 10261]